MAANWWKYGLCVFGGLGVGYLVGVKVTKNKAETDKEEAIESIREIYRSNNRIEKGGNKKEPQHLDKPEVTTKTSIQMERLSEKREKAEQAKTRYAGNYKEPEAEEPKNDEPEEDEEDEIDNWEDYIHVVDELPEDSDYTSEVLNYYSDGVLTHSVTDEQIDDKDIHTYVGENTLDKLDLDGVNQLYVRNDLRRMDYTIIYRYQEYSQVKEEEPYKAML